ncbi:phosphoribosyltransferase family protein [Microbacterium paraoxydans]|uniref:phosphoribosyltransferase family protein n=1 Tax=Microbacterium paraoxydans TaxID=199592 RepID=UPI0022862B3A|nr:phosphoribosyltransferase family protein [Microbacterium paraoxydans]MCZ0710579.1 phosphoribosyltransferase family protein [Microbacterium paraoxydans]
MGYTYFQPPVLKPGHSVSDWIPWLRDQKIVYDFLPQPPMVCDLCGKPCGQRDDGEKWTYCYNCQGYISYLDALVVGSYSFYGGLESLVGTYKSSMGPDGNPVVWRRLPLSTILWAIFFKHGQCIDAALGEDRLYTWVPSDDQSRSFDHIEEIIKGTVGLWEGFPWKQGVIQRNREFARPARNTVQSVAYDVTEDVAGKSILLFDDLWTTGGSMVSAAAALKHAGAAKVIGVVLGRQVNPVLSGHAELADVVVRREWRLDACPLCA